MWSSVPHQVGPDSADCEAWLDISTNEAGLLECAVGVLAVHRACMKIGVATHHHYRAVRAFESVAEAACRAQRRALEFCCFLLFP